MREDIKQKWVDALKSGKYVQGRKALRQRANDPAYTFCCLGVLCDLYAQDQDPEFWIGRDVVTEYLPTVVQDWAELPSRIVRVHHRGTYQRVAELNDSGTTFEDIAILIDTKLATIKT